MKGERLKAETRFRCNYKVQGSALPLSAALSLIEEKTSTSVKNSKLQILNLKPYTLYLTPWTLDSLAP
jgi:hypothetical protein